MVHVICNLVTGISHYAIFLQENGSPQIATSSPVMGNIAHHMTPIHQWKVMYDEIGESMSLPQI
jgi:hypothetical protein